MRMPGRARRVVLCAAVAFACMGAVERSSVRSPLVESADTLLAPAREALAAGRLAFSDSLAALIAARAIEARDSALWFEAVRQQGRTRRAVPRIREPIALALADSALSIGLRLARHDDVPQLHQHRGDVLHAHRRLDEAAASYAAARAALMNGPRPDTVLASQHLVRQSESLYTLGRYAAAIESLKVAIRSLESMARPDTVAIASALNGLASTQLVVGETALAESLWWHGLAMRRRFLPPLHADVAQSLANIATARHRRSDFEGAADFYAQAVRIYQRLGSWQLPYALDGLAHTRASQGRPLEARRLWEQAVDSLKARGEAGTSYALRVRMGLAELHQELGDHRSAREALEVVHEGHRRQFGDAHRETATAAAKLAGQRARDGDIVAALALARRASHTLDSLLGRDNERSWTARSVLAQILERSPESAGAEEARRSLLLSSIETLGPHNVHTAGARLTLARRLLARGALEEAESQVDSASSVFRRVLSESNPRSAELHRVRSALAAARGQRAAAVRHALAAVDVLRSIERVSAREFSEREAIASGNLVETGLGDAIRVVSSEPPLDSLVTDVWDRVIDVRMRVLDAAGRRRRLATRPDSAMRTHAETLEDARGAFARYWVRAARDTAASDPSVLAALRRGMEAAERALASADPVFAASAASDTISGPSVRAAVPIGDALVGYWRHGSGDAAVYSAFVQAPDRVVRAVALGPADRIEAAIERLRLEVGRAPARGDTAAVSRAWRAADQVTALLWTPLRAAIGVARRVHVVPDQAIARFPLTALTSQPGRYAIESGPPIVVRACERELIAVTSPSSSASALVVGDADFGVAAPRPGSGDCASLSDIVFAALPESGPEALGVARALAGATESVSLLMGQEATESRFVTQAPRQKFLHLATHAFVLRDSCESSDAGTRGVGRLVRPSAKRPSPERSHDRLLLDGHAGLAFAGANLGSSEGDDGILTAEEIVSLDLGDVECAVLSACETGVGPLAVGEGALGLHRAFRIAGTRSVVMSLWSLSDRAARDWSLAFWAERAAARPTWEAAWNAARRRLEAGRAGEASIHPFHWAAFLAWAAPGN